MCSGMRSAVLATFALRCSTFVSLVLPGCRTLHCMCSSPGGKAFTKDDERFMKLALRQAQFCLRGFGASEIPLGAVIVDSSGTIVAATRTRPQSAVDASAHAELECMRFAARVRGIHKLAECTLYSTIEPCAMCVGAALNFGLRRIVYAAPDRMKGACGSTLDMRGLENLDVQGGLLGEDAAMMLRNFFKNKGAQRAELSPVPLHVEQQLGQHAEPCRYGVPEAE